MDDLVKRVDALSVKPPKISKETRLLKWLRDVKRGVHPNEARGKSSDAQYASLMKVRKREECPYTDEEPELKEAWELFTTLFPPERHEDVYYLQWFGEKYRDTGDFDAACGESSFPCLDRARTIVDAIVLRIIIKHENAIYETRYIKRGSAAPGAILKLSRRASGALRCSSSPGTRS